MTRQLLVPEQLVNLATAPAAVASSISAVQVGSPGSLTGATDITLTFSAAVTVGNWLIVITTTNGSEFVVPASGQGGVGTWTQAVSMNGNQAMYYGLVTASGHTTVDAHEANSNFPAIVGLEVTGLSATTPLASALGPPGTTFASEMVGPVLTVTAGQLAVSGGWIQSGNTTSGAVSSSGWTALTPCSTTVLGGYDIAGASGTTQCAWPMSSGGNSACIGAVFNAGFTATSAQPGHTYYDTTLKAVGVYTGTPGGWVYFSTTTAAAAAAAVAAAAAAAAASLHYSFLRMAYR